ncbi:MAG: ATP-binding protein [Myxococcales bacterium]|nr:ATP-binding protein [Myxococcales bacterium]
MSTLHLVVGPVGAGKSTFAIDLSRKKRALRLTLDDWMVTLFSPDRPEHDFVPWYVERARRCVSQIFSIAQEVLAADMDCVLEVGLIQRSERIRFYERIESAGIDYIVYLLDAPREVRRQRVAERNARKGVTFAMEVSPEIFELASDRWEPPDESECERHHLRRIAPA